MWSVQPALPLQFKNNSLNRAATVEDIIHDQQAVFMGDVLHQIIQTIHSHRARLLIDTFVRGCADSNVVGLNTVVTQKLLYRDADGYTTAPDSNHKSRPEAGFQHPRCQPVRVFQQPLRRQIEFVRH